MSSKLKKYTIAELIKIVPHQVLYKALLFKEKILVKHFPAKWPMCFPKKDLNYINFNDFYIRCNDNIETICEKADNILAGNINIFNKYYSFNHKKDWLKDPFSQNYWPANVFCMTAPVLQKGCKDVKFVLEVNKMNQLVEVALAYYHTKDDKYIEYIDASIKGWKKEVIPGRSIANRIMMDLGFRIINLIQIILLCNNSDKFKELILPHILGIIKEHVNRIHLFSTPRWFKTGNGQNHVTGEMIGLILGQQCLQSFGIKSYKQEYNKEYEYLVEVLERTIAPSGAYLEQSSNYTRVVAEFLVCFDLFRKNFDATFQYDKYENGKYTKRLLGYLAAINYHDYLPNFGDNDDARVLVAFKKEGQDVNYLFNEDSQKYNNDNYLDGSQWIYRSKDENDIFIHTRIGKFTNVKEMGGTHAHNDILSINLGIKGTPVFIDKGCRFYNSGIDIIKEDRKISSHNTISIEGVELNRIHKGFYSDYPESNCSLDYKKDNFCFFEGILKYYDIEHQRKIQYNTSALLIEDILKNSNTDRKKGKIRFMLHPNIAIIKCEEHYILTNSNKETIAKLHIEGVDNINILDEETATSYATTIKTKVIEGIFDIKQKNKIITTIRL